MSKAMDDLRAAVLARVTSGKGAATVADRQHAFDQTLDGMRPELRTLLEKVAMHAYRVTDDDVAAAKSAGITEDQLFELIVCAALGQSKRQLDAATRAVDEAFR